MNKNFRLSLLIFILAAACQPFIFPGMAASIHDLGKPSFMRILDTRMYIVDNFSVRIYTLPDFKPVKTFLQQGAGPQEVKFSPGMEVFPGKLVIEDTEKILFFSPTGDLIKEMRKRPDMANFYPIGSNFVATRLIIDPKNNIYTQSIGLYDQDINIITELFKGGSGNYCIFTNDGGKQNINMTKDNIQHYVYKDRIYISDTMRGLFFQVFDASGKKLYDIDTPYEKRKISSEYKNKKIEEQKQHPFWNNFNYIFKEFFPAFKYVMFANDRIYLVTYPWKDDKCEIIVLDLKGKIMKKSTVPDTYLFTIANDNFYYLKENEEEEWEIFVDPIQ